MNESGTGGDGDFGDLATEVDVPAASQGSGYAGQTHLLRLGRRNKRGRSVGAHEGIHGNDEESLEGRKQHA